MKIVLASGNAHKRDELARFFTQEALPVELLPAADFGGMPPVEETGQTFGENAHLKAVALHAQLPPDHWALADDSGLIVDALDGAPGVRSARYAGEDASDAANVDKLLHELRGVGEDSRSARFACVLCLVGPGTREMFFAGHCEGFLGREPRGTEGFGYDPIFHPVGYRKSFAELGPAIKDRLSHRARALQCLADWLRQQP